MRGPVLKGSQVKLGNDVFRPFGDASESTGSEGIGTDTDAEPVVRFDQDGEVIRAIHITCSCGREMDLECVYDNEQDDGAADAAGDSTPPADATGA